MGKRKSRNKKHSLKRIVLILVILAAVCLAFHYVQKNNIIPETFTSQNSGREENSYTSETPSSENSTGRGNTSVQQSNSSDLQNSSVEEESNETEATTSVEEAQVSVSLSDVEIPLCIASVTGENGSDHEIHSYKGYTLCYRESYEIAEWVSYTLTREELNGVTGRTDDFRSDPLISTGSASPADYKKSGFDRGHLAPAADMEWSVESVSESFLMSNMTPQAPQFNRGIWLNLESQVRKWAESFGEVTVVTGPVLEKSAREYDFIGENQVAVPEYFYKALLAKDDEGKFTAIGFIIPNKKCEGKIWDYEVTVDEIEKRTGLDFFSLLPDSIETPLESSIDFTKWESN